MRAEGQKSTIKGRGGWGPWGGHRVIDCEHGGILSAIESLLLALTPGEPLYAEFHDGQVHDLLGGGACAFQDDLVEALLGGLVNEEFLSGDGDSDPSGKAKAARGMPARPIIMHAGAQPNNSPHCGTLLVFCYAFAVASAMRDRRVRRALGRGCAGRWTESRRCVCGRCQ